MRANVFVLLLGLFLPGIILGQHFVTLGAGYSALLIRSEGLDNFTRTYNIVNQPNLLQPLDGIDNSMGVRWEIGYRYVGARHYAVTGGFFAYDERDVARFGNGERRNFKFEFSNMYIEGEGGIGIGNFFVNGVLGLYFNRQSILDTDYKASNGEPLQRPLNGQYRSEILMGADIGLAAGLYRHPFFLVLKVTVPVLSGGGEDLMVDENQEKIDEGTERFPHDFNEFLGKGTYRGISSDIDGIKIAFVLSYAIKID